ncbi:MULTISPECIES: SRPBCC family protein [Arthrobacter]|uniref:hypothetical protein n=1 Tax=Arthrobacter TaxID=1663 RepID=UPI0005362A74|nr:MULTISPECIES: hypothetical protein [Arthrobacter]AIX99602.1 hypothetical protein ART_0004 [Arthrobacter sp. PAMC 25486]
MQNLFSHAHEPDYVASRETEQLEGVVLIDVPMDQAFDGFTDGIHLWWPVSEQSVFGEGSHVALLRDHLVEESADGEEIVWADISAWESPSHLALQWVSGNVSENHQEVDISFELADGGMTKVSVTYDHDPGAEAAEDGTFACDWSLILSRYARFMGGAVQLD